MIPFRIKKTIHVWLENFRATCSALKKKPRIVTAPINVAPARASIEQSPKHSALLHAAALGFSNWSVRRIVDRDLHMHPYKMMVTHELSERDFQTRMTASEGILQNIVPGALLTSSDEAHFHLSGPVVIAHGLWVLSLHHPRDLSLRG
ncbi:DUF4817 domain-containing protein [Trichonephila clavipes]|nr:DUF4817 domain-containing protein [Trichonephila clavipes]